MRSATDCIDRPTETKYRAGVITLWHLALYSMKTIALLAMIFGFVFSSEAVSAVDPVGDRLKCVWSEYGSIDGRFCDACGTAGQNPSIHSAKRPYFISCQFCNVRCSVIVEGSEKTSPRQCGTGVENALVESNAMTFGVELDISSQVFQFLLNNAPEQALVLASLQVVDGKIPQIDQRLQSTALPGIPSTQYARRLIVDNPNVAPQGSDLFSYGQGTSVRVDSTATKMPRGAVEITVVTSIIRGEEVLDVPRTSVIRLVPSRSKKLPVMDASSLSGDVLLPVSLKFLN